MSPKRYKILCEKCKGIKNKKAVCFQAKNSERDNSGNSNSGRDMKKRKRSRTTWRKSTNLKKIQPVSKMRVYHLNRRSKKDPSYDSIRDAEDYFTDNKITWKNDSLSRRISSSDSITCYGNTNLDTSNNELHRVPSMTMTEDRRPKKIRFKIPEGTLGYEDAKKAMWRSGKDESTKKNMIEFIGLKRYPSYYQRINPCTSFGCPTESIQEILPVLERLQNDDGIINSELDLNKIAGYIREEKICKRQCSTECSRRKAI